jgi:hypothetical protein
VDSLNPASIDVCGSQYLVLKLIAILLTFSSCVKVSRTLYCIILPLSFRNYSCFSVVTLQLRLSTTKIAATVF